MNHASLHLRPGRSRIGGWVVLGVLSAAPLLCGCQAQDRSASLFGLGASDPTSFTREDWSFARSKGAQLTSEHYVLRTTCTSKAFVDALPGFLEACWRAYGQLLPGAVTPDRKLEVYLFQSRQDWERFTEQFNPARAEVYKRIRSGGYSERGITVSHYSNQRAALSVLAHEGLHQYLSLTRGENIPPWLNEGLAACFEAFDIDSRTNRPIFKPETNYLRTGSLREALVAHSLIPLERILATHAGLEIQERVAHVRSYYAQVWSLVLFLNRTDQDNVYRDGFVQLLREVGTEAMDRRARAFIAADPEGRMSYGEAVFRAYVTDDLQTFQTRYEAYLHKLLGLQG
jgi:hypothetical protein